MADDQLTSDEGQEHRSVSPLHYRRVGTEEEAKIMLPSIPLDLNEHKLSIVLNWTPIILSSGILPIVLYFTLHFTTDLAPNIVLTIPLVIMGVVSLFALSKRTWYLFKASSDCRPLGVPTGKHGQWHFDWFHWNFLGGFIVLTIIISVGIALESLAVVALPTTILLLYVCLELVLAEIGIMFDVRLPWRLGSIGRGERLRPGVYVIADDVVAVDGQQGRVFRQAWADRYYEDNEFRSLLRKLDWMWGISGLSVVAVVWGVVFGVENKQIGFAFGWAMPWIWAGCMTVVTIQMAKGMLNRQKHHTSASCLS